MKWSTIIAELAISAASEEVFLLPLQELGFQRFSSFFCKCELQWV